MDIDRDGFQRYSVAEQTKMPNGTELTSMRGVVYYKAPDGWWDKARLQPTRSSDLRLIWVKISKVMERYSQPS